MIDVGEQSTVAMWKNTKNKKRKSDHFDDSEEGTYIYMYIYVCIHS
jgi:hypothetical protein